MVNRRSVAEIKHTNIYFILYLCILIISPFFGGMIFEHDQFFVTILSFITFSVYAFMRSRTHKPFLMSYLDIALLSLALCYLFSIAVAVNYRLAISEFIKYFNYFILFLMFKELIAPDKNKAVLLNVIYALITEISLAGLLATMGLVEDSANSLNRVLLSYHSVFGALALSGIALGATLFANTDSRKRKLVYIGLAAVLSYGFVFMGSIGAWIILPVIFLALIIFLWKRGLYDFITFTASIAMSTIFMQSFWDGVLAQNPFEAAVYLLAGVCIAIVTAFLLIEAVKKLQEKQFNIQGVIVVSFIVVIILITIIAYFIPSLFEAILPTNLLEKLQVLNDSSKTASEHLVFYADGLSVASNYPILGAGGGAWDSVYKMFRSFNYTASFSQSFFIQIWIEIGTLGLLVFLSALLFFFWFSYKNLKRYKEDKEDTKKYYIVLGASIGALTLVLHSIIAFDLSLSVISFILFAYIAVVAALSAQKFKKVTLKPNILSVFTLVLLAITSFFATAAFYHDYGISMANKDTNEALSAYQTAAALDPLNSKFKLDYATLSLSANSNDINTSNEAKDSINQAINSNRFDYYTNASVATYYLFIKDYDSAAYYAEILLKLDPLGAEPHNDAIDLYSKIYTAATGIQNKDLADTAIRRIIEINQDISVVNQKLAAYNSELIGLTDKSLEIVTIFTTLYNMNR